MRAQPLRTAHAVDLRPLEGLDRDADQRLAGFVGHQAGDCAVLPEQQESPPGFRLGQLKLLSRAAGPAASERTFGYPGFAAG